MLEYTVILLYPRFLSDIPTDTYTWCGFAESPKQALSMARKWACIDNGLDLADGIEFFQIAVIEGSPIIHEVSEIDILFAKTAMV